MTTHKKKFITTKQAKNKTIKQITLINDFILILFKDDTYCHVEYSISDDCGETYLEHIEEKYSVANIEDAISYNMITKEEGEIIEKNNEKERQKDKDKYAAKILEGELEMFKRLSLKYGDKETK